MDGILSGPWHRSEVYRINTWRFPLSMGPLSSSVPTLSCITGIRYPRAAPCKPTAPACILAPESFPHHIKTAIFFFFPQTRFIKLNKILYTRWLKAAASKHDPFLTKSTECQKATYSEINRKVPNAYYTTGLIVLRANSHKVRPSPCDRLQESCYAGALTRDVKKPFCALPLWCHRVSGSWCSWKAMWKKLSKVLQVGGNARLKRLFDLGYN